MAKVIIVDESDEVIGVKERELLDSGDITRVTGLWVFNSKGQVLLQKRVPTKKIDPNCWTPAVAGTVEEGESYDSNIVKEAEEEIGLKGIEFEKGPKKINTRRNGSRFFSQSYRVVIDREISDFKIEPKEVSALKWFSLGELKRELESNPQNFTPSSLKFFDRFDENLRFK